MSANLPAFSLCAVLLFSGGAEAQQATSNDSPVQYFGKSVRGVPVSPSVRAGKFVFVSGTPGFDKEGRLAVGDFSAQMKQWIT
jgi:2-iminobutanoate/2-iminopropanoate deaminase